MANTLYFRRLSNPKFPKFDSSSGPSIPPSFNIDDVFWGFSYETYFSFIPTNSSNLSLEIVYPEAIWAKPLASWFSSRGMWLIETWSKCFRNELALIKYNIKFSLMHLYSFFNCLTTNSKSPFISTYLAPKSNKIWRSVIKASFSTSLLEHDSFDFKLELNWYIFWRNDKYSHPYSIFMTGTVEI